VAQGRDLEELQIAPTDIQTDGSFAGEVTQAQQAKGTYGGSNADSVAGALFAKDHVNGLDNEEEFGLFVLERSN
jgi:hypothetical protein